MDLNQKIAVSTLFDKYQGLLTQAQRQALQLYLIEDIQISEIARIMATTRQAIYYHIKQGSKKLYDIDARISD